MRDICTTAGLFREFRSVRSISCCHPRFVLVNCRESVIRHLSDAMFSSPVLVPFVVSGNVGFRSCNTTDVGVCRLYFSPFLLSLVMETAFGVLGAK